MTRPRIAPEAAVVGDGDLTGPTRAVADAVYEALKADILFGRISGRMRFEELRSRYHASVGTVREVTSRLASEGLVETERHRWIGVPELSLNDFEDLLSLRLPIEQECLRQSIENGTDEWEASVRAAFHMFQLATNAEDNEKRAQLRRERHDHLHSTLVSQCRSRRLLWLWALLRDQAERYIHDEFLAVDRSRMLESVERHGDLIQACLERRSALAMAQISEDISTAARKVVVRLRLLEQERMSSSS